MEWTMTSRLKHAFNAFMNRDPTPNYNMGPGYSYRPDRPRLTRGNERSIVTSIYNRIALDVAQLTINRCLTDEEGRFTEIVNDSLNRCLNLEANIDQTGRAFMQDVVMSMLDEGCVAIVPVDTDTNPDLKSVGAYSILSMRTAKVISWYPHHVRLRLYDDRDGIHKEIVLPKKSVALVENPFYAVMNEPNSTAQRLTRKLSLLDTTDEHNASGSIDLIVQLPYVVKNETRKKIANERRKEMEAQLNNSKYGVAYIDSSERITQLNRSLENHLMSQVEYFTNLLFSQLNITQSILDGTADENTMQNYYTRTIEPIISAIVDEMKRKFLSRTALSQNHTLMFFRNPFKMISVTNMADIADKFTRNEITTSNEIRQGIGMKPSKEKKADELRNSNISRSKDLAPPAEEQTTVETEKEEEIQNEQV